jgi:hypothetical protein
MCGGKAASSGEVRSVRGAIFFWLLFFWACKRKVTYEILAWPVGEEHRPKLVCAGFLNRHCALPDKSHFSRHT